MLMRTDPLRELNRLTQQVFGTGSGLATMPMDAWKEGDRFIVKLDLPGVDPDRIDLDVEGNVITVRAERGSAVPEGVEAVASERSWGSFSRQLVLGEALDTEKVEADLDGGVLTLRVPISPQAKPRKIAITSSQKTAAPEKQQVEA